MWLSSVISIPCFLKLSVGCFWYKPFGIVQCKVPIRTKVVCHKIYIKLMDIFGCGPFVEMKFSLSTLSCFRGLLLDSIASILDTSDSTIHSLKDLFKNFKEIINVFTVFLHVLVKVFLYIPFFETFHKRFGIKQQCHIFIL